MRSRSLLPFATLLALGVGFPDQVPAQGACPAGRTALVLAGGGAKGFVHLGVLRMLDSLGIRPDFIVGTSMGAIIGALYASGYSGHDLDSLARTLPLNELVRPRTPAPSRAYAAFRPLVYWEIDDGRVGLAPAAIPEQEIDAALNQVLLRGNLQARGDFGRLPIPFYAVATDLATQGAVPLHGGDLAQAVRASVAIPIVFEPVRLGDQVLADGGLAANVPVRVARQLGADRLIISNLVRRPPTTLDFASPLTVATALIDYLFSQVGDSAHAGDLAITTDVTGIANLDFSPPTLDTLVRRGERATRAALQAGGACLPRAAGPAGAVDSTPRRVAELWVPGIEGRELNELLGTLGLAQGVMFDPAVVGRGLELLARDGRFRSIWLHPTPHDSGVRLDLQVRRAPDGGLGVGIAYDNELGARMWTGGFLRDAVTQTMEFTGILSFGGLRQELQGAVRRRLYAPGRPSFLARFSVGQEEVPFFTPQGIPDFRPRLSLADAAVGFEWEIGARWLVRIAGEARAWADTGGRGHEAMGGAFSAERATDDGEILTRIEFAGSPQFTRMALEWQGPIPFGRWIVTPGVRLGAIEGPEVPITRMFPLGGLDGFPGLHLLERRGAYEVVISGGVSYQLSGPLRLRAALVAGDTRSEGPGGADGLLQGAEWLVGWRVGLGLPVTPLGPVRLEYGATSVAGDYRDQVFLRVGRWF